MDVNITNLNSTAKEAIGKLNKLMNGEKKESVKEEVLLGIDHGDKYIGLAFGRAGLVSPIEVIPNIEKSGVVNDINRFCKENKITKIVIGLPLSGDGKETNQSKKVRQFAKLLRVYIKIPQIFVNETDTTMESLEESLDYGISSKSSQRVDHVAAALILKKYYRDNTAYL